MFIDILNIMIILFSMFLSVMILYCLIKNRETKESKLYKISKNLRLARENTIMLLSIFIVYGILRIFIF